MFFVYSGYVTPDNYDASEGRSPYTLAGPMTADEVSKMKDEFEEYLSGYGSEAGYPIFRVIQGDERKLKLVTVATKWQIT